MGPVATRVEGRGHGKCCEGVVAQPAPAPKPPILNIAFTSVIIGLLALSTFPSLLLSPALGDHRNIPSLCNSSSSSPRLLPAVVMNSDPLSVPTTMISGFTPNLATTYGVIIFIQVLNNPHLSFTSDFPFSGYILSVPYSLHIFVSHFALDGLSLIRLPNLLCKKVMMLLGRSLWQDAVTKIVAC